MYFRYFTAMNYKYIISPSAGRNAEHGRTPTLFNIDGVYFSRPCGRPKSSWLWDWMNAQADAQWDVADSRGWLKRISKLDAA